jgi:hypothetical protein
MTEAPKLTLVDRAMQGVDPLVSQAADRKVLTRYIGSISKTCYAEANQRMLQAAGAKSLEEFSQLEVLRAERDARPTKEEMQHAMRASFARGGLVCSVIVASLVIIGAMWITNSVIDGAFDAAGRIRAQSDMTDALVRSQQEPERNESYTNPGQDVTRRP